MLQTLSQNLKRTTIAPRAFFSERKSAGSPATSILSNARKSVENYGVFSLSFGTFLSLYIAYKEKEKYIKKKSFISKESLLFSSLKKQEEKSNKKGRNFNSLFYSSVLTSTFVYRF